MVSLDEIVTATPLKCSFEDAVFVPANVITHHLAANQLSVEYGQYVITNGLLPASTRYLVPYGEAFSVDWVSPGWFAIHEFPFRIGFSLPCSGLAKELLTDLNVAPCQLMPSVWKTIFAVEAIGVQHSCPLSIADLKYNFTMRSYGVGRYSFRIREDRENLIHRLDTGDDRFWYSAYFFVRKDSLGEECSFISTELRSNVDSWDNAPEDAGSKARIAKFLEVPVPERSWPLASVPLAPSFQHDLKKAMPSRSSASCRTRKITKPDEFLARVRAEGIKLPVFRRMGKPALASVSCSSPSGVTIPVVEPIVPETPKELENVIPEVERPKLQLFLEKKKKLVVEGPNRKRKAISIGHPSSVSFGEISVEPGDELLNQYAQAKVTESGLEDLAAKLISSMVQSLQCALVLGTSHRDLQHISDRSKTFANELEIAKKTNELKCKRLYERLEEAETASRRSSIEATGARLDLKECKEELELAQSELESLRHSQEYLSIYHNMSGRLEILTKPPGTYNLQEELRTFKHLYGGDSTFDEFIIQDADVRDRAVEQNAEDDIQGLAGNKSSSS